MSKVLTAEDILNETSSEEDSSSSDSPPPVKPAKLAPEPVKSTPVQQSEPNDQPEVDEKFGNIATSKSAEMNDKKRMRASTNKNVLNEQVNAFFTEQSNESSSDAEPDFNQTRRRSYRANQSESVTYKTFVDPNQESPEKDCGSPMPMGKVSQMMDEVEQSQIDDAKLLRMIEQESDSDEDSAESGLNKQVKSHGSILSEEDLLNRSLESEGDEAIEPNNFLRYASEKVNQKHDMLDIVDKNERSFKHVAEKMVQQSSQLIADEAPATQRRLTHQKVLKRISWDVEPTCIGCLEDYIALGFADGSVRLFDSAERELKVLQDKSTKGFGITCIDMKRVDKSQNVFVLCGHNKSQLSVYEIKGLSQFKTQDLNIQDIEVKHRKTIEENHKASIVNAKFVGDTQREILIMSSDVQGVICTTSLVDAFVIFRANQFVFAKTRLAAAYSIAPMLNLSNVDRQMDLTSNNTAEQGMKEQLQKKLKEVALDKIAEAEDAIRPQIVAFGTLEEVYVSQIKPIALALLSIKRPPYVQLGTIPYLDWGHALTPTFRDQAYPCVAIAWGQAIQLAVYSNKKVADKGQESPILCLDGFYLCDQQIDSVFFLSESLLFVIMNGKDVRILYTQNFTPGVYDEDLSSKLLNSRKPVTATLNEKEIQQVRMFEDAKIKYGPVSAYAEKDNGYKMTEDEIKSCNFSWYYQMTSQNGPSCNLNLTVCKNFGYTVTAIGASVVQRNLIHWEEYLDLIRRTSPDFIKVLKAALDIYNGKMIGLAGLPDQKEMREQLMREKMKDLLRQNINACIREFKEGQAVNVKTLRVATEFCIRVGAVDHLFGELYMMFKDGGVEAMYFDNLDAFILSGKLKTFKIPPYILDRLIAFYRQKDVQLLEQALLNLNLTKYSGAEDVRFMCEEELLSSALIHLITTIFHEEKESDSTTCLSILCSLFNIMMRAKLRSSQQEVQGLLSHLERFSTSVFELSPQDALLIRESGDKQQIFAEQRKLKIEIEHSSTYIGYKILWVVTMFMEGKKFPAGNLSELRWRYYVMDIVRFFTNERFLQWFLDFDPESFFNVLLKLFINPEPRGFIDSQDDFLAKNREANPFLEQCYTHEDIVQILVRKVTSMIATERQTNSGKLTVKSEKLQNAFLFFLTQICRSGKVKASKALSIQVVKDQIAFHKTLRRLPKKDLLDLGSNIYNCLIRKNEKDVIQVLVQVSALLTNEETKQLLDLVQGSPLYKLKIYLYQLQGDFQKCLNLFFQIKAIKSDVFAWLQEIEHTLKGTDPELYDDAFFDVRGVGSRITLNKMKELIAKNLVDFATMNSNKTVLLCQQWFDCDYMFVADELKDQKEICYQFLTAVLSICQDKILQEYNQSTANQSVHQVSERYKRVLIRLLEILGERKIKSYSKLAVELVTHNYFPIDEGITICAKRNLTEAHAVLLRRKGLYQESVALYIQAIVSLCVDKLMHTIFVEKNIKFEDSLCTNEHMTQFDHLVTQIIKICAKYGDRQTKEQMEGLWMFAIKSLFEVRTDVFKRRREAEEASDSDSSADRERHEEEMQFEKFVLIRNQHFLSKMSEHVNLRSVIQFLELCGHAMKYDDFRRTFEDKIQTELYFINILNTAIKLVSKEVGVHTREIVSEFSRGFKTRTKCDGCKMNLVNKFDRQEIWVMSCQHTFHARCIAKTEGQCSVCFNELDVIQSFQQLKQKSNKGKSDVDDLLQKREDSLKRSISLANSSSQKKRIESRQDRFKRCMAEHDAYEAKRDLHRVDFLLL